MNVNSYQPNRRSLKEKVVKLLSAFRWYLRGSDPSCTPEADQVFGLVFSKSPKVLLEPEIRTAMNYSAKE